MDQDVAVQGDEAEPHRGLGRAGILGFLLKVATAGASYLTLVALAHWMAPAQFGRYVVCMSLANICGTLATLGQPQSSMRFYPAYLARGKLNLAHGVYRDGIRITLFAGGGGCIAFGAGSWVAAQMGKATDLPALLSTALLLPGITAATYWASMVQALGDTVLAMAPRDLIWRLLVIGTAGAAALAGLRFSAAAILLMSAIVLVGVVAAQAFLAHRLLPIRVKTALPEYDRAAWRHVWFSVWIATSLTMVLAQVDVTILGIMASSIEAGLYAAVLATSGLLLLAQLAANMVLAPRISQIYHKGDMKKVQAIFRIAAPGLLLSGIAGMAVIIFGGDRILSIFGPQLRTMYPALIILSIGAIGSLFCGPVGTMLMMTGHQTEFAVALACAVVLSIVSQVIAIHEVGVIGAAIGNCIAQLALNVGLWAYIRVKTGIDTSVLCLFAASGRS